jgi:hypothetical protein
VRVAATPVGAAGGIVVVAVPEIGVPRAVDMLLHDVVSVALML